MNFNAKPTGLGLLLPAALNPALAVALGIGILGFGVYRFLDDDENYESEALLEPSQAATSTVEGSKSDGTYSKRTVCLTGKQQEGPQQADLDRGNVGQDRLKQEMIREAMSELGKRSAAARMRRKLNAGRL